MSKKIGMWILALGLSFAFLTGCAMVKYKKMYPDYEARVNRLKSLGGEMKAPYETAKSETYLQIFKHEIDEKDPKGAELFRQKLDQYLEQGMAKIP
jgi:hypothetical protein